MRWNPLEASRGDAGGAALAGIAVGAGLMYWLDPGRGAWRRAHARDQAVHAVREARQAAEATARDLANRTRGLAAEARSRLRPDHADDDVVIERVRSKLGRLTSHPSAVEVHCRAGAVQLKGPILASEVDRVLRGVGQVRGVRRIDNALQVHVSPDVSALQGCGVVTGKLPQLLQLNWSPAARLLVAAGGIGLLAWAVRRRGLAGALAGGLGIPLAARALTNRPLARMLSET